MGGGSGGYNGRVAKAGDPAPAGRHQCWSAGARAADGTERTPVAGRGPGRVAPTGCIAPTVYLPVGGTADRLCMGQQSRWGVHGLSRSRGRESRARGPNGKRAAPTGSPRAGGGDKVGGTWAPPEPMPLFSGQIEILSKFYRNSIEIYRNFIEIRS